MSHLFGAPPDEIPFNAGWPGLCNSVSFEMEHALRRPYWMITPALVMVAAFFGAQGIMQVTRIGLMSDAASFARPPLAAPPRAASETGRHATSADAILARNPFDSETGPLGVAKAAPSTDANGVTSSAVACEGVKVHIIAASSDPDWSYAALSDGAAGAESAPSNVVLRRRGGDFNGKKIEYVGTDRVWLDSNGSICQARLFSEPASPEPASPRRPSDTAAKPAPGGATSLPPEIANGIKKVGANEYDIDRGVVDLVFERQGDLFRHRIVPALDSSGKTIGINIFGVSKDSVLGKLGIENADRIQQVNGFDAGSPEKMLEALGRLRTANHLTLTGSRNGKNFAFDYNIK
ncbi:general secretion pathway protein GspC [Pendulispora rubella]|uniref:General secretion pathway protein GspC n=1 Tax=Pendulispora rubella TaxID=2741070 RepID=A0ABZ2KVN6_9BACT